VKYGLGKYENLGFSRWMIPSSFLCVQLSLSFCFFKHQSIIARRCILLLCDDYRPELVRLQASSFTQKRSSLRGALVSSSRRDHLAWRARTRHHLSADSSPCLNAGNSRSGSLRCSSCRLPVRRLQASIAMWILFGSCTGARYERQVS
jgi:hypothetical protein